MTFTGNLSSSGAYSVIGIENPDYDQPSYSAGCTGTIGLNQSKMCTVTFTYIGPCAIREGEVRPAC